MKIPEIFEACFVLVWVLACASADADLSRDNIEAAKRRLKTKFFHGMGKRLDMPYQTKSPYQPADYGSEQDYGLQDDIEEHKFYTDLKKYISNRMRYPSYNPIERTPSYDGYSDKLPFYQWLNGRREDKPRQEGERTLY